MQAILTALAAKAQTDLAALKTRPEFEAAKARLVGPNGELTALMKQMGSVPKEERPALGKLISVPFKFEMSGSRIALYQPDGL